MMQGDEQHLGNAIKLRQAVAHSIQPLGQLHKPLGPNWGIPRQLDD